MTANATVLEMVDSLPPFRLLALIIKAFAKTQETYDTRSLIDVIKDEPSITAKVIGMANTAYYRSGDPVGSVESAVARLGIQVLRRLVLALAMSERFDSSRCPGFNARRHWFDAMAVAHCACNINAAIDSAKNHNDSTVYCIALLHNIGFLLLVHSYPQTTNEIICNGTATLINDEREVFSGDDHYSAGGMLLRHWGLPPLFYQTIAQLNTDAFEEVQYHVQLIIFAKSLIDGFIYRKNFDEMPDLIIDKRGMRMGDMVLCTNTVTTMRAEIQGQIQVLEPMLRGLV